MAALTALQVWGNAGSQGFTRFYPGLTDVIRVFNTTIRTEKP